MTTMSKAMGSISHADLNLWRTLEAFAYPPRCTSTCMASSAIPSKIAANKRSRILPPQCSSIRWDLEPLQDCRGTMRGWTDPHSLGTGLQPRLLPFVCLQCCGHCGDILTRQFHHRSSRPARPPNLPHPPL